MTNCSHIKSVVAQSPAFKNALTKSIADAVGVNKSNVHIISVTSTTIARNLGSRELTTSAASVNYVITTTNGASALTLTTALTTAITSGTLTNALAASSPALTYVTANSAAVYVNISPTSSPTIAPTHSSPPPYNTLPLALGLGIGGGGLFLIAIGLVAYYGQKKAAHAPVEGRIHNSYTDI